MEQLKVYGYIRVSTDAQDFRRQEKLIKDYCDEKQHLLINIISEKISGASKEIKSINDLTSLTKEQCDLVLISEMSRLSRDEDITLMVERITPILRKGIKIIFLDNPQKIYDIDVLKNPYDIFIIISKAAAAAEERAKIIYRTTTGKANALDITPYAFTGNKAPFGFKTTPNPTGKPKTILAIDEDEKQELTFIYESIISGRTVTGLTNEFNEQGKRTPRNNAKWSEAALAKIVHNTLYKGERVYKGKVYNIEPIIEPEKWELANQMIKQNQVFRGTATKNYNPLKGLFFCPCGYGFLLRSNSGSGLFNYVCAKRQRDKSYRDVCKNSGLGATFILNTLWYSVSHHLVNMRYRLKSDEEIIRLEEKNDILTVQKKNLEKDIDKKTKELDILYDRLLTTESVSIRKKIESQYGDVEKNIEKIKHAISKSEKDIASNNREIKRLKEPSKIEDYQNLSEFEKAQKYKEHIKKIVYYSHNLLCGWLVIDYKNGYQTILALNNNGNNRFCLAVPDAIGFNKETRKVVIKSLPKSNMKPFEPYKEVELDFKQYVHSLQLEDYNQQNFINEISLTEIDFKGLAVQANYTETE